MRGRGLVSICAAGLVLAACAGQAQASDGCGLEGALEAEAVRAVDAETLELADGRQVRLINYLSPRRPMWLDAQQPWPAAERAHEAVSALVAGRTVSLAFDGRREDRRGRLLAQVHVVDGENSIWVQGEMIERGLGRAWPQPSARTCVSGLLHREAEARRSARGIWRDSFYRVRKATPAEELLELKNAFAIVEGKVLKVARVGSRFFLNFEEDWRRDFTVIVSRRSSRLFQGAGDGLNAFAGAHIRVRGWMETFNGPMIEISHPEQIEILDE